MSSAGSERQQPRGLIRDIELHVLECKVCFERFGSNPGRRPCGLPCGHAVCWPCAWALSRTATAPGGQLECPFCRWSGPVSRAADCLPLLQLAELVSAAAAGAGAAQPLRPGECPAELRSVFGGWGELLNPRGLAVCSHSGALAVVQDGEQWLRLLERSGGPLPGPGPGPGPSADEPPIYPLDVAVAGGGRLLAVTDAGDRSVKVFARGPGGRLQLLLTEGGFGLPWGLDSGSEPERLALTDWARGSLLLLELQPPGGRASLRRERVCHGLCHPREVAVSRQDGCIHVVEHPGPRGGGRRLKTFNSRGQLLRQVDGLGRSPGAGLGISGIAVDGQGNVLLADGDSGTVLWMGGPDKRQGRSLIERGLVRPVALAWADGHTLMVLDAGDHTLKVYTVH
ncbi:E3 ubiquitin-protein ligase NHLRC1-like [Chiloscyllium plagiosum]|uniref:E3 ubiquitin-protein ligase NHLRC1-like n=1 Tax=Chiloscyllium plagiosum TaxID=36176 RepID=UPI001CB85AAF|nr:E3 ubiquitin-protein ligase NHLRC1-like [Chiloscyllium plagiosum]